MPNSRKNLANSALQKALQRLHYPLEVMLTSYGQKIPNACQRFLHGLTGSGSGRLACAHRALRLPALG